MESAYREHARLSIGFSCKGGGSEELQSGAGSGIIGATRHFPYAEYGTCVSHYKRQDKNLRREKYGEPKNI
jgi:hypothetical protein